MVPVHSSRRQRLMAPWVVTRCQGSPLTFSLSLCTMSARESQWAPAAAAAHLTLADNSVCTAYYYRSDDFLACNQVVQYRRGVSLASGGMSHSSPAIRASLHVGTRLSAKRRERFCSCAPSLLVFMSCGIATQLLNIRGPALQQQIVW